jgi:hypothetical protein
MVGFLLALLVVRILLVSIEVVLMGPPRLRNPASVFVVQFFSCSTYLFGWCGCPCHVASDSNRMYGQEYMF